MDIMATASAVLASVIEPTIKCTLNAAKHKNWICIYIYIWWPYRSIL